MSDIAVMFQIRVKIINTTLSSVFMICNDAFHSQRQQFKTFFLSDIDDEFTEHSQNKYQ